MDLAVRIHAGLQAVLDTALDAVVVMDLDGRVLGWNDHAAQCFGWSADEAAGRKLSELIIPPAYRPVHERGLARYLETGVGPVLNRRIEVSGLHRDGREIPIELSITDVAQFGERLFVGFLRDISERRTASERQQRLLSEFNHRVKNMLSVVIAISHQTARNAADIETFQKAFMGRLETLAEGHDLLLASEWKDVELSALAERVLGAEVAAGRASVSGESILLSANRVMGLVLILHELFTNAVKYGALSIPAGTVALTWQIEDGEVALRWRETGLEKVETPSTKGFGQEMIAMTARADLQGAVEFDWRSEGLAATIRFPVVA